MQSTHTHTHTYERGRKERVREGEGRPKDNNIEHTHTHTLRPPQQTPVTGAGVLLPAGWHPLLYKGHTMPHTHKHM